MKKLFRFRPFFESESDVFQKQTITVDNTYRSEFNGNDGLYMLAWYSDDDMFSVRFPNEEIKYYRLETLLQGDEATPLSQIEDGKLLSFIRHMIYTEDYNRTAIADEYKVEGVIASVIPFTFTDGGYKAEYEIDIDGNITLTMPARTIVGTPDQICTEKEMGGLASLFGGKLIYQIAKDYQKVTGKNFWGRND